MSYQARLSIQELTNSPSHPSPWSKLWELPENSPQQRPSVLYAQGTERAFGLLAHLPDQAVAFVGTRDASPRSCLLLKSWIGELAGSDRIIISGLARGIDQAAHAAAIEAGLPTIAVVAGGLDQPSTRSSFSMRERILQADGLILTESPPGTPARPFMFLERNRLISAWSQAIVVVEAAQRSGALNTAAWAREHDRACFAVPCSPGDPRYAGNQKLLDDHHAQAFWGPHSLGSVWLDLAARNRGKAARSRAAQAEMNLSHLPSDVRELAVRLGDSKFFESGVFVRDFLDLFLSAGWSSERFFVAFNIALSEGLMSEKNGLLLKNPSAYV